VSDAGLAQLAGLAGLRRLNLVGTRVTPKEAARLAGYRPDMDLSVPYQRSNVRGSSRNKKQAAGAIDLRPMIPVPE
jgi:hypothetical protein